jgi:hypothetical protein
MELSNINIIKRNLCELKSDYLANSAEIFNLERRLTDIQDSILKSKVSNFKIFENLNAEKPTPAFLSIARNKTNGKLSGIRNATGIPFLNDSDRNNYILNTFQELYRNHDSDVLPDNVIENFLGPEILDSDLVKNSKLTQEESIWLDRPLTLSELDIYAKKGKFRSAPGADGFSNKLIMKCWPLLRKALFNYANFCLEKGIL